MLGGPTPLWVSTYTSYILYKGPDPFCPCRHFPGQSIYFKVFYKGQDFASQIKKLRKRTCLVDQLPCGSVLTPAPSCTKFQIHSAHADSSLAKVFIYFFQGRPVFASQTKKLRKRTCLVDQLPCGSVLIHQLSLVQSSRSIQPM